MVDIMSIQVCKMELYVVRRKNDETKLEVWTKMCLGCEMNFWKISINVNSDIDFFKGMEEKGG